MIVVEEKAQVKVLLLVQPSKAFVERLGYLALGGPVKILPEAIL